MIELQNIHYAYPDPSRFRQKNDLRNFALKSIHLRIEGNTRIGILGANGSGKTTLLHILNGLIQPTQGEYLWKGKRVSHSMSFLQELRKCIGTVFQDPEDQLFAPTVFEDVCFGPRNMNLSSEIVQRTAMDALASVNMSDQANLPIHMLSFGQKKRVALAGVLAMQPEVLLLDEPTAGLDPKSEKQLLDILHQRCRQGSTILFSTHDVDMAFSWTDRIIIMSHGEIVADLSPKDWQPSRANLEQWDLRNPRIPCAIPRLDLATIARTKARLLVCTGNGKGKTTAALGMALRSIGHGHTVAVCQFIKHRYDTGEHKALARNPQVRWGIHGKGFLPTSCKASLEEHRCFALRGWRWAKVALCSPKFNMVILDEVCNAIDKGLVPLREVIEILSQLPASKVVVCTGRNAPPELIQLADTVTEMNLVKHGFHQGITAQAGVEK